ncbi:MAG: hypothetical protein B7Y89_13515 [Novosphingobium sp. 32-60-15]|uniref:hypothetical protein n=1 Tax=unclassified Novosphingobium TaxID=2644732 RepID=UPI000BCF3235|nr:MULTISPECIES: hypothetical protein [unclassified Novosphingobium]OYX61261.1 MAG: hypothetical protein B7Y89_13515 [Novosphingobium sp. 32-60-15]
MTGIGNSSNAAGSKGRRLRAPVAMAVSVVVGLLLAPTVSSAFSSGFDATPVSLAARGGIGSFTPASVDERLASQITVRALKTGRLFRFTPAGNETRTNRAVTVAVRLDSQSARAFSVRSTLADGAAQAGASPVRIAPVAYNLGMARGFASFAAPSSSSLLDLQRIEMPDLAKLKPVASAPSAPSRFAPRVEMDGRDRAGRAPRTLEGQGDYQLDLGGSYRLTRNLNVTAGVRYSPERDRILPLTDGKQDNQAVYVGTQFRF